LQVMLAPKAELVQMELVTLAVNQEMQVLMAI
jgi:hypothetical protein